MAHAGAKVILTSRKVEAGQEVARQLQSSGVKVELCPGPVCSSGVSQTSGLLLLLQGHIEVSQLDLADLSSVHRLAKQLSSEPSIDLLFLNAGVMACPQSYTKNGFEMQVGTNHFGHFELTRLLMDKFREQVITAVSTQNLYCNFFSLHSCYSCLFFTSASTKVKVKAMIPCALIVHTI